VLGSLRMHLAVFGVQVPITITGPFERSAGERLGRAAACLGGRCFRTRWSGHSSSRLRLFIRIWNGSEMVSKVVRANPESAPESPSPPCRAAKRRRPAQRRVLQSRRGMQTLMRTSTSSASSSRRSHSSTSALMVSWRAVVCSRRASRNLWQQIGRRSSNDARYTRLRLRVSVKRPRSSSERLRGASSSRSSL
jgi:hypothetical protein